MSSKQINASPEKRGQEDSVVWDEMIVPEEKPTELQLIMKMFSMDRQQRIERDRERDQERLERDQERLERDQRMDTIMEHLFESQSKLAERLVLVSEDIEKIHQGPAANTSPNGQIVIGADADAEEQGGGKVFSSEPALKVSPIDQVSDQSPGEVDFFLDSANYGFQKRAPLKKRFGFDSGRDASRRESKVISDMMYNIQRSEAQNVYKMVTAERFTKKLSKLDITHFCGGTRTGTTT
jgi:hypothetical protein